LLREWPTYSRSDALGSPALSARIASVTSSTIGIPPHSPPGQDEAKHSIATTCWILMGEVLRVKGRVSDDGMEETLVENKDKDALVVVVVKMSVREERLRI